MKRDKEHKIVIKQLGRFEVLFHDVSDEPARYEDIWNCIYEHVEVYTDSGQKLLAYKYCESGFLSCFDKTQQTENSKVQLLDNHPHHIEVLGRNWRDHNPYQNCLGYCVLDGDYWINLSEENLKLILTDDSYEEVGEECREDHLLLYYSDGVAIHVARYNAANKQYEHKLGSNRHWFSANTNVPYYTYDSIRYYARRTISIPDGEHQRWRNAREVFAN